MQWNLRSIRKGRYEVYLKYGAPEGCEVNVFKITMGDQVLEGKVKDTGGWYTFQTFPVGELELDVVNESPLTIQPKMLGGCSLMNLKEVILLPVHK